MAQGNSFRRGIDLAYGVRRVRPLAHASPPLRGTEAPPATSTSPPAARAVGAGSLVGMWISAVLSIRRIRSLRSRRAQKGRAIKVLEAAVAVAAWLNAQDHRWFDARVGSHQIEEASSLEI